MTDFTDSQRAAIDKIEKLLALAAKAGTPHEAEAANKKAQELLLQHNLDAAALEDSTSKQSAKREQAKVEGGHYAFQRDLWRAVAELNFCRYFQTTRRSFKDAEGRYRMLPKPIKEHNVIGRVVNSRATMAMASYLQDAIERMAKKRVGEEGWLQSSQWAWDYRRGAFQNVIDRIKEERRKVLSEEEKKARKAAKAGMDGAAGTALTVAGYTTSEEEANYAFQYGEEALADRKERAAFYVRAETAYALWAKDNPGKAAEKFEFEGETPFISVRSYGGRYSSKPDKTDWSAYKAGNNDGKNISLHAQAGDSKAGQARITGSKAIHL